jgi:hypothetical protein
MKKKWLDYLAIPNSSGEWKKQRYQRAVKELEKRHVEKVIILKGRDSEEDILYLGNLLQKGDKLGIDTFPLHFKEYQVLIKKAKRDGKFPKGIRIENIRTNQTIQETIYGVLGLAEEEIKNRKLGYIKDRNEKILSKIKKFIHRFI